MSRKPKEFPLQESLVRFRSFATISPTMASADHPCRLPPFGVARHCNYHARVTLPESFRQPYNQRWQETILGSYLKIVPLKTYHIASRLIHICISMHSTFMKLGMHVPHGIPEVITNCHI
jgi:hypothetical protein